MLRRATPPHRSCAPLLRPAPPQRSGAPLRSPVPALRSNALLLRSAPSRLSVAPLRRPAPALRSGAPNRRPAPARRSALVARSVYERRQEGTTTSSSATASHCSKRTAASSSTKRLSRISWYYATSAVLLGWLAAVSYHSRDSETTRVLDDESSTWSAAPPHRTCASAHRSGAPRRGTAPANRCGAPRRRWAICEVSCERAARHSASLHDLELALDHLHRAPRRWPSHVLEGWRAEKHWGGGVVNAAIHTMLAKWAPWRRGNTTAKLAKTHLCETQSFLTNILSKPGAFFWPPPRTSSQRRRETATNRQVHTGEKLSLVPTVPCKHRAFLALPPPQPDGGGGKQLQNLAKRARQKLCKSPVNTEYFWPSRRHGVREASENNRNTGKVPPVRNAVFSQQQPH